MSIREKALSESKGLQARILDDPELGPVVLRHPGFMSLLELNEKNGPDRLIFMLLNFVFEPVLGEDGEPLVGEDGSPLVGKPAFEKPDEEALRTTDHPIDGWFVRVIEGLNAFIADASKEAELGKQ